MAGPGGLFPRREETDAKGEWLETDRQAGERGWKPGPLPPFSLFSQSSRYLARYLGKDRSSSSSFFSSFLACSDLPTCLVVLAVGLAGQPDGGAALPWMVAFCMRYHHHPHPASKAGKVADEVMSAEQERGWGRR